MHVISMKKRNRMKLDAIVTAIIFSWTVIVRHFGGSGDYMYMYKGGLLSSETQAHRAR